MKAIRNFFIWIYSNIELWLAIQRAEKAFRGEYVVGVNRDGSKRYLVGNRRYYVMPDADDRLIIMSRRQMHKLRIMKVMSEEVKARHLMEESFYYTADASKNGIDSLREYKRKKYYEYRLASYERRKRERKTKRLLRKKIRRLKNGSLE